MTTTAVTEGALVLIAIPSLVVAAFASDVEPLVVPYIDEGPTAGVTGFVGFADIAGIICIPGIRFAGLGISVRVAIPECQCFPRTIPMFHFPIISAATIVRTILFSLARRQRHMIAIRGVADAAVDVIDSRL